MPSEWMSGELPDERILVSLVLMPADEATLTVVEAQDGAPGAGGVLLHVLAAPATHAAGGRAPRPASGQPPLRGASV